MSYLSGTYHNHQFHATHFYNFHIASLFSNCHPGWCPKNQLHMQNHLWVLLNSLYKGCVFITVVVSELTRFVFDGMYLSDDKLQPFSTTETFHDRVFVFHSRIALVFSCFFYISVMFTFYFLLALGAGPVSQSLSAIEGLVEARNVSLADLCLCPCFVP